MKQLLDAFGSAVSLEDIASAYCRADRNVYDAGELLCNLLGSTSSSSTYASKEESLGSDDDFLDKSNLSERNGIASKQKKGSASMGTVSGLIGREYSWSGPSRNESPKPNKPLKLYSEELPSSEIWDEKVPVNTLATAERMPTDTEEFLFKMLGDGFQLDMNIIQEVLGKRPPLMFIGTSQSCQPIYVLKLCLCLYFVHGSRIVYCPKLVNSYNL